MVRLPQDWGRRNKPPTEQPINPPSAATRRTSHSFISTTTVIRCIYRYTSTPSTKVKDNRFMQDVRPRDSPSIYALILWHFIHLLSAFAHVPVLLLGVISLQRLAAFCRGPWRKFIVGWKISARITCKYSNSTGGRHFYQLRVSQNAKFNAQMNSKVVSSNKLTNKMQQFHKLTFRYSSTCFGRLHDHHQELTTALTASGFTVVAWW